MEVKTWAKNAPSPYELKDITHFPHWGCLTICDAFFNNLTSGLMVCAAIAWAAGGQAFFWLLPFAMTLALLILIIDLVILVADLGDSTRFLHSLRVMRFTSPLSVGVWGLSWYGIFLGLATVLSWILLFGDIHSSLVIKVLAASMRFCAAMAVVGAIVVICYKGVVFSCSSQPGLCQARWLTAFMVSDSLLMGMSLMLCLAILFYPGDSALHSLIMPTIILNCARGLTYGLLWQDVKYRARKIYSDAKNRFMAWVIYLFGGIIPIILLFCGYIGIFVAVLLILACSFYERDWLLGLPRPLQQS